MAKPNWGRKHLCLQCQAPFYDLRRDPIACPKCGVAHRPVALLKSDGRQPRRNRLVPTLATAAVAEAQDEPAASPDPETPELDDTADEEEEVDDAEVDDAEAEPAAEGSDR
jgi:uncharacterized protein (TIGR02300 family)